MEAAEVTASSGNVVMVKEEEREPAERHGTQVILHLQPLLPGANEETADMGTTVLAIETHHDESQAEGVEVEYGYPITCGDSRAVLLFKKFVCPGINVRCVKFNEQLISPKQFVHLAGKATLKDWKRAIRLGGVMLRKMMDSGQIDFYQHDTVCTNTCRSTKFDGLNSSVRLSPGSAVPPPPPPPPPPTPPSLAADAMGAQLLPLPDFLPEDTERDDGGEPEQTPEQEFTVAAELSPGAAPLGPPTTANGHVNKRKRADMLPDGALSMWKGVADIGLMGEVLSGIQTGLMGALRGVEVRSETAELRETDAVLLNSLCEMLGLLDSVKRALELRRSHTEENQAWSTLCAADKKKVQRKGGSDGSVLQEKHPRGRALRQNLLPPLTTTTTTSIGQALAGTGTPPSSLARVTGGPQPSACPAHSPGVIHRAGRVASTQGNGGNRVLERVHSRRGRRKEEQEEEEEERDSENFHVEPGESEKLHGTERVTAIKRTSKKCKTK